MIKSDVQPKDEGEVSLRNLFEVLNETKDFSRKLLQQIEDFL